MNAHQARSRSSSLARPRALAYLLAALPILLRGTDIQLVSTALKSAGPDTASGDSVSPFFSGDGRRVVFTSSANNLTTNSINGLGVNVFIRELATQHTRLVSVASDGLSAGNQASLALGVSKDGSRVLFSSDASNLLPQDSNRATDLFVRDLTSGTTLLVTGGPSGEFLRDIGFPTGLITEDGLRVMFESDSSLLVNGDENISTDIFQRDLSTGLTTRINVTPQGSEAKGGLSHLGAMSASGHRVAFTSFATNLVSSVPAGKTATTAYVRDLQDGSLRRLFVDVAPETFGFRANELPQLQAVNLVMSSDGRYVALATAKRLTGASNIGRGYVFWFDLETGASALASGTRNAGAFASVDDDSGPVMSEDGKIIAFEAEFEDILPAVTSIQIWRADGTTQSLENPFIDALIPPPRAAGPVLSADGKQLAFLGVEPANPSENQLYRHRLDYATPLEFGFDWVSASRDGTSSGSLDFATYEFSHDGNQVLFDSNSSRIVSGDSNNGSDVFLRDLGKSSTELLSPVVTGGGSLSANGISSQSRITSNGRYVGFLSLADNVSGQDLNLNYDLFRHDLTTGITELVSALPDGEHTPTYGANTPSFSADGRWVAFVSAATNLVDHDTSPYSDVFVRDMQTKVTRVASRRTDGLGTGNGSSSTPVMSADGSVVVFVSQATDLAPNTPISGSARNNLFAYDTSSGTLSLVSKSLPGGFPSAGNAAKPSISGDGKTIAYVAGNRPTMVMLVNPSNPTPLILHTNASNTEWQTVGVWVSEDGSAVVYDGSDVSGQRKFLIRYDTATGLRTQLPLPQITRGSLAATLGGITRNGQAAVFTSWAIFDGADTNATKDVFLARFDTAEILLISGTKNGWIPGNKASDSPSMTPDGSRITFRSEASNLVDNDINGVPDIFVHDVAGRITRLVSMTPSGHASNDRSAQPSISADGQRVAFVSWADDLTPNDFNHFSDVFVASNFDSIPGDSDRDGLPDAWELAELGNLSSDGTGDEDGDGSTNSMEFLAGTQPRSSSSVFHPRMVLSDLGPMLQWDGVTGKRYTVEVTTHFSGPWMTLGTVQGSGKSESFVALHGAPAGVTAEFYRVRVQ